MPDTLLARSAPRSPAGLADLGVAGLEPPLVADRGPHDERDRCEGDDPEHRLGHEEHDADEHDVDQRAHQLVGADVEEPLELVDVVVEDRQQPAGRLVLEPGELEPLDVAVGVHAGLVLDGLRQVPPQDLGDVVGERLDDPHADVDGGEHDELLEPVLDAEDPGDDRVVPPHDDVHRRADEQLGHDVGQLVDDAGGDGGHHRAAVPSGVRPQADEGGGGVGVGVAGHGSGEPREASVRRRPDWPGDRQVDRSALS